MRRGFAVLFALLMAAVTSGQTLKDKSAALKEKEKGLLLKHLGPGILKPGSLCVPAGQIGYGQTVTGALETTDCILDTNNSYTDYWQFQGTAGDIVSVDLSSTDFDAYLLLFDGTGKLWTQNDDFGSSFNAHVSFTLTSTDTWVIAATNGISGGTGVYNLNLQLLGSAGPPSCSSATALCLESGRFTVSVAWHSNDGKSGQGNAISFTDDTGYFWFFSQENVELVVKVLDGRAINGHFWVFYGALSDVQYTITVTDTTNGAPRSYNNPQGHLASFADTSAF